MRSCMLKYLSLRDYNKYQGILEAVGAKRREIGSIAAQLNTPLDTGLRKMVSRLVELEFLEEERDFASPCNRPVRYRLADPALRFYYGQVLPNESAIDVSGPVSVWNERIRRERFPSYVGQEVVEEPAGKVCDDGRGQPQEDADVSHQFRPEAVGVVESHDGAVEHRHQQGRLGVEMKSDPVGQRQPIVETSQRQGRPAYVLRIVEFRRTIAGNVGCHKRQYSPDSLSRTIPRTDRGDVES